MINNTLFKPILLVLYFSINHSYCFSQDRKSKIENKIKGNFHVKWVGQIPSAGNLEKNEKIAHKLVNVVLGEKNIEISKPVAILRYTNDSILILDQGNQTILTFSKKKDDVDYFFDSKTNYFPSLVGICLNRNNNLVFTDSKLNKLFIYNQKDLTELNSQLKLQQPTGIAYSKVNNEIWVVETHAHKITILDEQGRFKRELGGRGIESGKFNFPTYIWIDDSGTVYIIDSLNYRIQIFNKEGKLISVFGEQGDASGYFARPKGVATDSYGNIYIVDALFHAVQIFDKGGNFLYQFGNQGRGEGEFWLPSGIFIDKEDFIYVADSYNSRIQIFQLVNE